MDFITEQIIKWVNEGFEDEHLEDLIDVCSARLSALNVTIDEKQVSRNTVPEADARKVINLLISEWDRDNPPFMGETRCLPIDHTSSRPELWCRDQAPEGVWFCTRLPNHTGRHAAGNGTYIVAVW